MILDFRNCKTPEDVERVVKPLGDTMAAVRSAAARHGFSLEGSDEPAARAYREGRVLGALLVLARKARVAWSSGDVRVMTDALQALTAAELAAGVDLTSPTKEDLVGVIHKAVRKRRAKKGRR